MNARYKQIAFLSFFSLSLLGNLLFLYNSINNHLSKQIPRPIKTYIPSSNRQTIYDLFTVNSHDIVFIGTSHTEMFDVNEFFPNSPVKNRGISGDVTARLLTRLPAIIKAHPNKIFLEIGFNDVLHQIPIDTVINNIEKIILSIKSTSPKTKIYITNIFPSDHTQIMKADISRLNNLLVPLCKNQHVVLIDAYSNLSQNGALNKLYDSGDGMHLNGKGYLVWSVLLKTYL